jgi:Uma2 family endonuclease
MTPLEAGSRLARMNVAVDQWPKDHLINVDEYYRMAEVGLLAPDARVELIEGRVVDMAPIGTAHADTVDRLLALLFPAVRSRARIGVQRPVRLGERSEPQPDIVLFAQDDDRYRDAHPTANDVLLIVEVSDSTLKFDLGAKLSLYAQHNIPEVWVLDIVHKRMHCARQPAGLAYRSLAVLCPPDSVAVARSSGGIARCAH